MYSLFAMHVYYFKFSCCFVWQTNNILFLKCLIINSMLLNLIHLFLYDFLWQFLFNSVLCFQFFTGIVTNFNGSSNISFSFIILLLKERIYILHVQCILLTILLKYKRQWVIFITALWGVISWPTRINPETNTVFFKWIQEKHAMRSFMWFAVSRLQLHKNQVITIVKNESYEC